MVGMNAIYTGGLHCEVKHGPSGSVLETDAPKDNQGKGERFSPTDLVGAALASCILTTMAMVAERDGIDLMGATAHVEKEMTSSPPRKIASLPVQLRLPKSVPEAARAKLEHAAHACPVSRSLGAEIAHTVTIEYV